MVFNEIRLPATAPDWMADRAALWNAVEAAEKRRDSRLAKEVEFALPRELPRADWTRLAREMADAYVSRGFAVDLAIHDDGTQHNPHCHMMMTTREISPAGFGGKLRELDGKAFLKELRAVWQEVANAALARAGVATTIDARSHAARGIDRDPGQHQGPNPTARRERRERMEHMPLSSAMEAAHREMLAEEDVRARYPKLSAREDWPPREPPGPSLFASPERQEEDRFWAEVEGRSQPSREGVQGLEIAPEVEEALERVRTIESTDAPDHSEALSAIRQKVDTLRDKLTNEMVRAGLLAPRTADQLKELENRLYPTDFERKLAEARRIEAKRREVGHVQEPTREDLRRVAARERAEEERLQAEWDRSRQPRQEPDPDGRAISGSELDRAQTAMLREVESPTRNQIQAPHPDRNPDGLEPAREAVVHMAELPVSDRESDSYRLAPQEQTLSWLEARKQDREQRSSEPAPTRDTAAPGQTMAWLRQRAEGRDRQPEHDRDERDPERDGRR